MDTLIRFEDNALSVGDGRASVFSEPAPDLETWGDIVAAVRSGRSVGLLAFEHGCSEETIRRIVAIKTRKDAQSPGQIVPMVRTPRPAAPRQPALRPLPETLAGEFGLVRLTQVVQRLHGDYVTFADGADTDALRARLIESLAHARQVVRMLENQVKARREERPAWRYPVNPLSRVKTQRRIEDGEPAGAADVERAAVTGASSAPGPSTAVSSAQIEALAAAWGVTAGGKARTGEVGQRSAEGRRTDRHGPSGGPAGTARPLSGRGTLSLKRAQ